MKKVLLVHPLRHHAYHSLKGIVDYSAYSKGFFGYYNKGDLLDVFVNKSPFSVKLSGYSADDYLSKSIITDPNCKIRFLIAKGNGKFMGAYLKYFDEIASKEVRKYDTIHVLQDYCNSTIRSAISQGIPYVYEQIQPFDYAQIEYLEAEIEKVGFPKSYINNRFPQQKIERQLENLEHATAVVSASKATELSIKKYVNNPIFTFPYGANVNIIESKEVDIVTPKHASNRLKVLYVGNISLIKGVHYIIDAAVKLSSYPIDFTFVGKPASAEDLKLVNKIKKMGNCTYIESIPHAEINYIYQHNDVFIFQGLCEGFGMVSLEAMSNGLPCIVSEGGCGIIKDSVSGFINKNGDVESIINRLIIFLENRDLLCSMSINAINEASKCTWDVFSANITRVYQEMIGK